MALRTRGVSAIVVEALLIVAGVAAAITIYLLVTASAPSHGPRPSTCLLSLEALRVNTSGIYAWIRAGGQGV